MIDKRQVSTKKIYTVRTQIFLPGPLLGSQVEDGEPSWQFKALASLFLDLRPLGLSDLSLVVILFLLPDLPESHSAGPVPVGLLHTSGGWGGLPGCLGGQLLPGGLPSGGLAGSLLGSGHGELQLFSWLDLW